MYVNRQRPSIRQSVNRVESCMSRSATFTARQARMRAMERETDRELREVELMEGWSNFAASYSDFVDDLDDDSNIDTGVSILE